MSAVLNIPEERLLEFGDCPLLPPSHLWTPEATAAKQALKWLLSMEFRGQRPSLSQLRERCERYLDPKTRGALRVLPAFCRRLRDLLDLHTVMQPMAAYTLSFGMTEVTGEYAVLRGVRNRPLILRLYPGPAVRQPDLLSLVRWEHFHRLESHHRNVGVVNYSLLDGSYIRTWLQNSMLRYAGAAVEAYSHALRHKAYYPTPGAHCASCMTQPCLRG